MSAFDHLQHTLHGIFQAISQLLQKSQAPEEGGLHTEWHPTISDLINSAPVTHRVETLVRLPNPNSTNIKGAILAQLNTAKDMITSYLISQVSTPKNKPTVAETLSSVKLKLQLSQIRTVITAITSPQNSIQPESDSASPLAPLLITSDTPSPGSPSPDSAVYSPSGTPRARSPYREEVIADVIATASLVCNNINDPAPLMRQCLTDVKTYLNNRQQATVVLDALLNKLPPPTSKIEPSPLQTKALSIQRIQRIITLLNLPHCPAEVSAMRPQFQLIKYTLDNLPDPDDSGILTKKQVGS